MAAVTEKVVAKYKAVLEQTKKRPVNGVNMPVLDQFTDPEDPRLAPLIADGDVGYLRITEVETGKKIHGIHTSVMQARDLMRACLTGRYNPFPKVRNKKREWQAQ